MPHARCQCVGCGECTAPYDDENHPEKCGTCGQNQMKKAWNHEISGRRFCVQCKLFWVNCLAQRPDLTPARPTDEEKVLFRQRDLYVNSTTPLGHAGHSDAPMAIEGPMAIENRVPIQIAGADGDNQAGELASLRAQIGVALEAIRELSERVDVIENRLQRVSVFQ